MRRLALALSTLLVIATCGRTEPLDYVDPLPDAGADAGVDAGFDAGIDAGPTPCIPGVVTLTKAQPTVMFVIDRSGSMGYAFSGGTTRWRALTQGLASVLPPVDRTMAIGAYLFPSAPSSSCGVSGSADLLPALGNVAPLTTLLGRSGPRGGTPTAVALENAARALRTVRAAKSARALVLATDGAPGCNSVLDPQTCACTTPLPCSAENCLDDTRTISRMAAITQSGLPTWVIGIEDGATPVLVNVLDRMAVAGGRPRPNSPRFYPATSAEELRAALLEIREQVGGCTYLTASVPDAQGNIRVFLDGQQIFENTIDGWQWADRTNGEFVFSGQTCTRATRGGVVTANVGCSGP